MPQATCPDRQTWERLIQGEYPPAESQVLEAHLSSCDRCSALLSDTFFGLQSDTQIAPAVAPAGEFEPIASELKSLWHTVAAPARPAGDLAEYAAQFAPLQPGEAGLGRLGHYLVKNLLGKGGMGCVLLAQDTRLSREVALKIMTPMMAGDASNKSRFLREAQAVAAIRNDHVVEIHHVDEDRGVPYFVMPLLRGETLETRLRREKRLPYADVLRIGREIALGLAAAHGGERKVIHRDIKPSNIWLESGNDRVKLFDFGLALDPDVDLKLTETGSLLGSAPYMSPEQASCTRTSKLDERTDLFSLGSVLYEMCTGRMAFKREGLMHTLNAVVGEQPTPPAELVPDLPVKLSRLVMRLLAKTPGDRPESAADVVAELQNLQREARRSSNTETIVTEKKTSRPQTQSSPKLPKLNQSTIAGAARLAAVYVAVTAVDLLQHRLSTFRAKLIAASGGLLSLAFLAVIVINTGKGQLEIVTDDSMQVTILEGKDVLIKDVKQNTTLRLRPGTHEFEVLLKDAAGEELGRFTTTSFKIVRGGKPVLDIRQESAKAGITINRDRRAAEWLLGFQGSKCRLTVDGQSLSLDGGAKLPDAGKVSLDYIDWVGPETPIAELIDRLSGTNIRFLNLQRTTIKDADLKQLPGLEQLSQLQFREVTGLTDDCLIPIAQLPALHTLSLDYLPITDAGIAHLEEKSSLSNLALTATNITDRGISSLRRCANLMGLELAHTQITDQALQDIASLKKLTSIGVGGTGVTERGLEQLDQLPNLEKVALWGIEISDAAVIRLIEKHPRLDLLNVGSTPVTDAIIPSVLTLKNLHGLLINGTSISGNGYDTLKRAFPEAGVLWVEPNDSVANTILSNGGEVTLRVIGTEQDQIFAKPVPLPKELFRLRRLHIGAEEPKPDRFAYEFGGAIGAIFGGYPSTVAAYQDLTVLEFSGRWFTDANMQQLRRNEHPDVMRAWSWRPDVPPPMSWLRELSLTNTAITDDALAQLGYFQKLHKLDLSGTNLRGSGLKHLKALSELRELNLACPALTEVFLPSLTELPKLEVLSLANSGIADGAVATLKQLKHLKQLDLTGTKLSPQAIEQLKAALPDCQVVATH